MTLIALISYVTIITLPVGGVINGYKCGTAIGGLYDLNSKTVYVCGGLSDSDFILHHELGHYFWFNYLSDIERSEYTETYNKAYKIGTKGFYREYSRTSAVEDFADNFALSFQNNQSSFLIRKRIKLINKYLKTY